MDREEFERLRDLPGKRIAGDITLKRKRSRSIVFESGPVPIEFESGSLANVYLEYNEATEAKTINVIVVGTGPICRLEVDLRVHREAGRDHKHALKTPDCPSENLARDVSGRPDLSGLSFEAVFETFCKMAHIEHEGTLKFSE